MRAKGLKVRVKLIRTALTSAS
ncbi:hypothetical protein LINPERPRIM_LOCUS30267 [Linum perenne]